MKIAVVFLRLVRIGVFTLPGHVHDVYLQGKVCFGVRAFQRCRSLLVSDCVTAFVEPLFNLLLNRNKGTNL